MVKCVFCGKDEESFRGMHYIKNDGSVNYFCSSKCRKNQLHLGRDRRKFKWTQAYRDVRTKAQASAAKKSAANSVPVSAQA